MSQSFNFKFKLAQTVIAVSCCLPTTKIICTDYLVSDREPSAAAISVTPGDIMQERAYLTEKKEGAPLEASTPEALERLVLCRKSAELLPQYGAVLFHGSALAMDGEGILFTAASGTGKSTHAALWRQVFGSRVVTINDDKPFLRADAAGFTVFGSPWRGKHRLGANTAAPVKAICVLHRGEENTIRRLTPREALPILMQQTYRPRSLGAMLPTMQMTERLSREVPVYALTCNMDPQAAWVAWRGINLDKEEEKS